MSARFSPDDYAAAARALMPRGPAWPDDAGSVQGKVLAALALALWRSDGAAVQLLADAFPATAAALLDQWEATLGLPDPVIGTPATDDGRRTQIVSHLVGAGGQSRARFVAFAAALGFTITIAAYAPLRAGHFSAGAAATGTGWAFAWSVHVTANTGTLNTVQLKAALDAIRPAETTILLV